VVQFSYSPIEARKNTYYAHMPYSGQGKLEGYAINDTKADICLTSLLDMIPTKAVKIYDDDGETDRNLDAFIEKYGVAFAIEFDLNTERANANSNYKPTNSIPHQIWISPMTKTEDGVEVYYMFNETYDMVVMMERRFVEFLEWNDYKWVEPGIFEANIIYLKEMNIVIKNGTAFGANEENAGLSGVTNALFDISYVDDDGNAATVNSNNADIRVFYGYTQNGTSSGKNLFSDTVKFKYFYQSLHYSELYDAMPSGSEALQQQLKGTEPDLEITMLFDVGEGKTLEKVYRFYFGQANSGRGCYVTINNNGSFYMRQSRVDKIVSDLGRLLAPDTVIDPTAKN
jgi:hypothetical protein